MMFSRFGLGLSVSSVLAFSVDEDSFTGSWWESCNESARIPKIRNFFVVIFKFRLIRSVSVEFLLCGYCLSNFYLFCMENSCTFYHKHESLNGNFTIKNREVK